MIYIDCDDVLAESTRSYIAIIKREFGIERKFEELTSFDLRVSFGLSQAQFDHFFHLVHTREEILKFKPLEGAVETLRAWNQTGLEIAIVTGRITAAYEATLEWLQSLSIPYDHFMVVDKYNRPEMDMTIAKPLSALTAMNFELAIEDSYAMAKYLAVEQKVDVALMNRPWNIYQANLPGVKRVSSWEEIRPWHSLRLGPKVQ
ncbi:MAG TPA: hypothetical protein VMW01_10755 [Williamwhitmania sp.]|nr:hypothetical protein [Williamwhitmania sp.]